MPALPELKFDPTWVTMEAMRHLHVPLNRMRLTVSSALLVCLVPVLAAGQQSTPPASSPEKGPETEKADEPVPVANEGVGPLRRRGYAPKTQREKELFFRYTDNFVAVIGDDLITQSEVLSLTRNLRPEDDPTTGREDLSQERALQLRFNTALERTVERRLKASGGRNLGFDPDFVARVLQNQVQRQIEGLGGAAEAGEGLRQGGYDVRSYEEALSDRLFVQVWEDAHTGHGAGPSGRAIVDNYVRPGRMFAFYRDSSRSTRREARELVGQRDEQVVLRQLILVAPSAADADLTLRQADALRTGIEGGVIEFEQAVSEYAPPTARGADSLTMPLPMDGAIASLAKLHGAADEVEGFFKGAGPGDISPVFEVRQPSGVLDYAAIYRIERIVPATARLPFLDPGLQGTLNETIREKSAELEIERGLAGLARSTFVFPGELRGDLIQRGRRVAR